VHSEQSVRVVEKLENEGKGLNLTWEVRDGIRYHSHFPGGAEAATHEGRVVRFADKIAYMNHDIDDAIRAGVLREEQIPGHIRAGLGNAKSERITALINAIVYSSGEQIRMDDEHLELYGDLRAFLFENVYTNPEAKGEEGRAKGVVRQLYQYFVEHPGTLPAEYLRISYSEDAHRAVCDYISGMSDRYCVALFDSLFVPKSWNV
jgi:dGTPase